MAGVSYHSLETVHLTNLDFIKLAHEYGWAFAPDYATKEDYCLMYRGAEFVPAVPVKNNSFYLQNFTDFRRSFDFDKNVVLAWKNTKRKKPRLEYVITQMTLFQRKMEELEKAAFVIGDKDRQDWLQNIFGLSLDAQIKQYATESREGMA